MTDSESRPALSHTVGLITDSGASHEFIGASVVAAVAAPYRFRLRQVLKGRMLRVVGFERSEEALDEPMDVRALRSLTFERFFAEEQERLLRALSVITGSRREAEDLAQEAFVKVFERWDTVAAMDQPAGYLHRTAMNLFRNQYRRARVAIGRAVGLGPQQDVFKSVDDRDVAARALAALTARQRAALVLTEALGYSGEEAGRLLGIKASTVSALTHQARTALRPTVEVTDD